MSIRVDLTHLIAFGQEAWTVQELLKSMMEQKAYQDSSNLISASVAEDNLSLFWSISGRSLAASKSGMWLRPCSVSVLKDLPPPQTSADT